jgi:hypothetical protein
MKRKASDFSSSNGGKGQTRVIGMPGPFTVKEPVRYTDGKQVTPEDVADNRMILVGSQYLGKPCDLSRIRLIQSVGIAEQNKQDFATALSLMFNGKPE